MNILNNLKKILIAIVGVICCYLSVSSILQLTALPEILRISPGQEFKLKVSYPLSFYRDSEDGEEYQLKAQASQILTDRLLLNYKDRNRFDFQLRLFGAIPLKKVRVEVAEPPMVIPGGQAIGVLFSTTGVVVVGYIPFKGIDQKKVFLALNSK